MFDLLEKYKKYLSEKCSISKSTYNAYIRDVSAFLSFVDISVSHDINDVTGENIEEFKKALLQMNKTPATINRTIASVRNFYKYLKTLKIGINDPTENIHIVKFEKKMPKCLGIRIIISFLQYKTAIFNQKNGQYLIQKTHMPNITSKYRQYPIENMYMPSNSK